MVVGWLFFDYVAPAKSLFGAVLSMVAIIFYTIANLREQAADSEAPAQQQQQPRKNKVRRLEAGGGGCVACVRSAVYRSGPYTLDFHSLLSRRATLSLTTNPITIYQSPITNRPCNPTVNHQTTVNYNRCTAGEVGARVTDVLYLH
jgi:hypothetical protein